MVMDKQDLIKLFLCSSWPQWWTLIKAEVPKTLSHLHITVLLPNTCHLNWNDWIHGELACAWLHLCWCVAPRSQRMDQGQWLLGERRWGWRFLEGCVIKAHKTASSPAAGRCAADLALPLHAGHLLKDLFPRSVVGACHHQATCFFSWHSGRPAAERADLLYEKKSSSNNLCCPLFFIWYCNFQGGPT